MHDAPRIARPAMFALVGFLLMGAAVGQPIDEVPPETDERGGRLVAAIHEALASTEDPDRTVRGAVDGITNALHESVTGGGVARFDEDDVCAYLVGTGGTKPRLDGGGDLLSVFDQEWPAVAAIGRATHRVEGYGDAEQFDGGLTLVVIDDFNLEALAVSVMRLLETGAVPVDATTEGNDLWRAVVAYRFDLQQVLDPEAAYVPHGHLVAYHALSLLPTGSRIKSVAMPKNDHVVLEVAHVHPSGSTQTLAVHLFDIDFDDVQSIRNAMYESGQLGAATVVLSWGLVDCFLARAYEETGTGATLAEYIAERLHGRPDVEHLVRRLCAALAPTVAQELDAPDCAEADFDAIALLGPLAYFSGLTERTATAVDLPEFVGQTYFAAAGNQKLGFPMPPAAWRGIHAVEACAVSTTTPEGPGRAWFSNLGTMAPGDDARAVTALGAWFPTDEVRRGSTMQLGYWGTSFAAPAAAVQFLERGLPGDGRFAGCRGE